VKDKLYLLIVVALLATIAAGCVAPTAAPAEAPAEEAPAEEAMAEEAPAAEAPEELSGKVTVWYDSGAAWNEAIADLNARFAEMYPNVEVEWVTQDAAQLSAKLVAAFAADQGPDIAMGSAYRLTAAEEQFEAWEDLSDELASDTELQETVAALPAVHVESYYKGDKLWGLPQVVQSVGLFVRKSWLDNLGAEVPTNWQELSDLAVRFTTEDPDGNGVDDTFGYCIFGAPGATNSAAIQFLYSGAAAGMLYPITDLEGKPSFNNERGLAVAQALYDWQHTYKVTSPATPSWTHAEFYAAVQAGQCGIGRVGAWNIGAWKDSEQGSDFVIVEYPPMSSDQAEPNYQVSWTNAIAMSSKAVDKDAVYAYFKFLESKEGQSIFYSYLTSAARTDLDWPTLTGEDEHLMYFTEPRDYALELVNLDTWGPTIDVLSAHLNAMLADPNVDPATALAEAEQEALEKYEDIRGQ
jgi:ABC-type glycerol-3-phosphate transport system substrate-binding protein